jgi:hypothetical protein
LKTGLAISRQAGYNLAADGAAAVHSPISATVGALLLMLRWPFLAPLV